jgi:putative FmdB family regulatory protein
MPIYEYLCDDCGAHYEQIVLSKSAKIACPKCASQRHTLQLSVFSAPAKNGSSGSSESSANGGNMPGGSCCGMGGCGCN